MTANQHSPAQGWVGLFSYRTWQSARQIAAYCRTHEIALIHSNSTAVFAGGLAASWLNIPHIWHVREIITQPAWLNKIIANTLYRFADTIVAVSGPACDQLLALKPAIQEKITVINDGIRPEPFAAVSVEQIRRLRMQWGANETTTIIGMVGRLNSWKGQDFLLDAAAAVLQNGDNSRLVFVGGNVPGEEWRTEEFQKRVDQLGLAKLVCIDGFRLDIPEVMAAFDIFVLPSIRPDPFPVVVLEAMASGKPVIATAHGGSTEMLLDGETGYLVSPTSTQQLTDALHTLTANPELGEKMGQAGQLRLMNNFTTDRYVHNIEALYKQFLP
jgi:glycosyltransferase involved in cell wall biosynthesis